MVNIKLSKTQAFNKIQSGGFFVKLLGPLMKVSLEIMKNVIIPLGKNGLTAASADAKIHKES